MLTTSVNQVHLVVKGVGIIDGTGRPQYRGDVAVRDDRIVLVGRADEVKADVEIDGSGKAVAPGFIDVHTHDDAALLSDPLMQAKVSQGVTTVVTGNCGISLAPVSLGGRPPPPLDLLGNSMQFFGRFQDYLKALDESPAAVNAVCLVGHTTLRVSVMDRFDRAAERWECAQMCLGLEEALSAGAFGLSTGLFYRPAHAAPTEEVIMLAQRLPAHKGIYCTHMRDEADGVLDSLEETFCIGRRAGVPVIISHHKCAGAANHGRSIRTLARINQALNVQEVGLDVYPYIASSTILDTERMMGATRVFITWSETMPSAAGRDLADIAAEMGRSVDDAAARLQPAGAIYFMMDEDDVRRILAYPHSMIGSDGLPHDRHPHPRLWGTFPRVLGKYVREIELFSLEEAVRKMTSLPAAKFGLAERGVIKEGAYADLVIFDPQKIEDTATFEHPTRPAAGVCHVIVNGCTVWHDGASSGNRPGRVIRRDSLRR